MNKVAPNKRMQSDPANWAADARRYVAREF